MWLKESAVFPGPITPALLLGTLYLRWRCRGCKATRVGFAAVPRKVCQVTISKIEGKCLWNSFALGCVLACCPSSKFGDGHIRCMGWEQNCRRTTSGICRCRQRSLESQEEIFAGLGMECFEQTLFLSGMCLFINGEWRPSQEEIGIDFFFHNLSVNFWLWLLLVVCLFSWDKMMYFYPCIFNYIYIIDKKAK